MSEEKKYSHLDFEKRSLLEKYLNQGMKLEWIAEKLCVSASTISREIKRNRRDDGHAKHTRILHICKHRKTCAIKGLCATKPRCKRRCATCQGYLCSNMCENYTEDICRSNLRFPFVCNGCVHPFGCVLHRYRYEAKLAQKCANQRLRESREGINCTREEFEHVTEIVRPLLKQNIGLDAIWSACGGDLGISKRTFYRWVELGYGFCNLDLPKKVCYKKRKSEKEVRPRIDFSNRTYSDFSNLDEQVRLSAFEADCICGVKTDSKAILTLLHKRTHFQIGILLEKQDSAHVISAIDFIESVSSGRFRDLFATILADRGSEFLDILGIEREGKRKRCSLYFCDPRSPHQKGQCEKNHVEVRKILPKGTSFDELDSADIAEVFSHVNSTPRTSLGGISPIELAFSIFPKSLFEETGLRHIPLNELCLKPLRQIRK